MFTLPDGELAVIGDTHQDTQWTLFMLRSLIRNRPKIDYYVQVGDFGLGVGESGAGFLRKVNRELKRHGKHLFVLLGNHDNYDKYGRASKSEDYPGTRTLREAPNIHFFERQSWFMMNNKKFLTVCGANSINRQGLPTEDVKINGVRYLKSWWKEEQITDEDVANAISGGTVDFMLSHEVPIQGFPLTEEEAAVGVSFWGKAGVAYAEISAEQLQKVLEAVKPKTVIHGHYHKRATKTDKIWGTNTETTFESLNMNGNPKGNTVIITADGTVTEYDARAVRK